MFTLGLDSRKRIENGVVRTRQQILQQQQELAKINVTYSGLVNTGNTCYMNSVLQALSSAPNIYQFLVRLLEMAEAADLDAPIAYALRHTIEALNEHRSKQFYFRPRLMEESLRPNKRFRSGDQQDAQELFQVLSMGLAEEEHGLVFATKSLLDLPTLNGFLNDKKFQHIMSSSCPSFPKTLNLPTRLENPLLGLTANRVTCSRCGYTEAIRHFVIDCLPLTLPSVSECTLDDCLREYTRIETLTDLICRKCSIKHTLQGIEQQLSMLPSRTKRRKTLQKKVKALQTALTHISEETILDGHIIKVKSPLATKQIMIAKPPRTLVIHLSRSMNSFSGYIHRNHCHVEFPEELDLSPYTTTGELSIDAFQPISTNRRPLLNKNSTNTINNHANTNSSSSVLYKLEAVVVHLGSSHSYGHYIAYRRTPNTTQIAKLSQSYSKTAYINGQGFQPSMPYLNGLNGLETQKYGWLKISDEHVRVCSIREVLGCNPYLLLYERVE